MSSSNDLMSRLNELESRNLNSNSNFYIIIFVLLISLALSGAAIGISYNDKMDISGGNNITVTKDNSDPDFTLELKEELKELKSITAKSGTSYFNIIGGLSVPDHIISGGSGNSIQEEAGTSFSAILGGNNNTIESGALDSVIAGGNSNTIRSGAHDSVIAGGIANTASGEFSFIGGGGNNTADGYGSFIGGADNNTASGDFSFTGGGYNNEISKNYSFIGGGSQNEANSERSFIGGGILNVIGSSNSFIGGGEGLELLSGVSFSHAVAFGKYNSTQTIIDILDGTSVTGSNYGSSARLIIGTGDSESERRNALVVDDKGNLFLGDATNTGSSVFHIPDGESQYKVKAFTIQHPEYERKWLIHGCLEGPEGGVYYRGKGEAPGKISLPSYATKIATDFTVNVTPIGEPRPLGVTEVDENGVFSVNGEGKFFWQAIGERVKIETEPDKEVVNVKRLGPYSWVE